MKRYLHLFLVFLALSPVLPYVAAVAQDTYPAQGHTPEPILEPAPDAPADFLPVPLSGVPVTPVDAAASRLLDAIVAIVGLAVIQAPITTFIVSVLKRIDSAGRIPSSWYAVFIGGVLTVIVWVARHFGVEAQVNSLFDFVVVAGPYLLNFLLTLTGASALYKGARASNAPIVGYERPKKKVHA